MDQIFFPLFFKTYKHTTVFIIVDNISNFLEMLQLTFQRLPKSDAKKHHLGRRRQHQQVFDVRLEHTRFWLHQPNGQDCVMQTIKVSQVTPAMQTGNAHKMNLKIRAEITD